MTSDKLMQHFREVSFEPVAMANAIDTALREARNQALEEVTTGINAIAQPPGGGDKAKGYYAGWKSAGDFVEALKHKDGQP